MHNSSGSAWVKRLIVIALEAANRAAVDALRYESTPPA